MLPWRKRLIEVRASGSGSSAAHSERASIETVLGAMIFHSSCVRNEYNESVSTAGRTGAGEGEGEGRTWSSSRPQRCSHTSRISATVAIVSQCARSK